MFLLNEYCYFSEEGESEFFRKIYDRETINSSECCINFLFQICMKEKTLSTIRITVFAQTVIKPDCSGKEILVRRSPQTQDVN